MRLLEDAWFDVVGRSGTAADLLLKVRSYSPDVALVDIRMPPTHTDEGLQAAKEIRAKHPDTAVLVLSQYAEPGYALELLQDCVDGIGYLLKTSVSPTNTTTTARFRGLRLLSRPEQALWLRSRQPGPSSCGLDDDHERRNPRRTRGIPSTASP